MAFRRDNKPSIEQVAAFLQDAVSKVKENPDGFEELRQEFKRCVPLTLRSLVAAYILDKASNALFRPNNSNNFKGRNEIRPNDDSVREYDKTQDDYKIRRRYGDDSNGREDSAFERQRYQHIEIAPDVAATVFVGVGKNRRVYPKDIVGLFISVAGIEKDRIGDIKVYANYSFVQLFKDDAEKVINALNGYDYRGRRLSVSYSRQRPQENFSESREDENPPKHLESDTRAQQAAFAATQTMSDEDILAARAPRSSSSEDL